MPKSQTPEELRARYGASATGAYFIADTIGVPHPFCIGSRHVEIASDRFGGMLSEAAVEDAYRRGYGCQVRTQGERCRLAPKEHETGLIVSCPKGAPLSNENEELQAYLLHCKPLCEEDAFAGFAFMERE